MEGRLLPKYKNRYQGFSMDNWKKEFVIASQLKLDLIDLIFNYEDYMEISL